MKEKVNDFGALLSPLEQDILKQLWPSKKLRVRQIYDNLKSSRTLALSSVAVLLDRLHDKRIVSRQIESARGGLRYVYSPSNDKKGFEKSVVETAVNKLIEKFGSVAVSYFNERFAKK